MINSPRILSSSPGEEPSAWALSIAAGSAMLLLVKTQTRQPELRCGVPSVDCWLDRIIYLAMSNVKL